MNKTEKADRLPPHSPEAEQGVLGCILMDPGTCIPECLTAMPSGSDVFYDLRHRLLYENFLAMYDERKPIDVLTIFDRLKTRGLVDQVGGISYIASLPDSAPSVGHLGYYVSILTDKRLLRAILRECGAATERVWTAETVEDVIGPLERGVLGLRQESLVEMRTIKEITLEVVGEMEDAHQSKGGWRGLSTGFADLDKLTGGLKAQDMIVVAGRPGTGKTTLAMNIAEYLAVIRSIPVGIFSLEMSANSLVARTICSMSRVESGNIREGGLLTGDFLKITNAVTKLAKSPLYIIDKGCLTIRQMHAMAKRLTHQHGIKLWIIDYLQLIRSDRKGSSRYEETTDVSHGIKGMAKDLNVPIMALAQISRDVEKDDRKPRLSDLRDSGAIEQDADLVLFLHKPDVDVPGFIVPVQGLLAKHRSGPTGMVPFTFFRQFTRYESAAPPDREPMPDYNHD